LIYLTKKQLREIVEQCRGEYPKEACGILAGRRIQGIKDDELCGRYEPASAGEQDGKVSKIYKMANISENPEVCYFMDPKEQLRVFKEMRRLGVEMLGIYHSHTASPAYPSARDCEMAFYPEAAYVIVSLQTFNDPTVRAFRIVEGEIKEIKIEVAEDE